MKGERSVLNVAEQPLKGGDQEHPSTYLWKSPTAGAKFNRG